MFRHIALLLIIVSLFMSYARAEFVDVVAKIKPSVVGIGIHTPTRRRQNILRGTGGVIGDGRYIVTNDHVLPILLNKNLLQKIVVFIGTGRDAKVREAEIVATSSLYDLAILKIFRAALPAMTLASSELYADGSSVTFTGFPMGGILGLYPVIYRGIVEVL
jgi:serine protease Do